MQTGPRACEPTARSRWRALWVGGALAALTAGGAVAQSAGHGSVYDRVRTPPPVNAGVESMFNALSDQAALSMLEAAGIDRARAERAFDSVFVPVLGAPSAPPLTPEQNAALAAAIGREDDDAQELDNPGIPAGHTFLGQFVDHDVTFNEVSCEDHAERAGPAMTQEAFVASVEARENCRTATLDLDSVYGVSQPQLDRLLPLLGTGALCGPGRSGPCLDASSLPDGSHRALSLYELDADRRFTGRFRIGLNAPAPGAPQTADLPRCGDSRENAASPACGDEGALVDRVEQAVIGDGRNDENILISQIHLVFLLAHNRAYEALLEAAGATIDTASLQQRAEAFLAARRSLIRHWQAVVLDDYLHDHVGAAMVSTLSSEDLVFYTHPNRRGAPYCAVAPGAMPDEFAAAGFRHGHSQVRAGYGLSGRPRSGAGFDDLFGSQRIAPNRELDFSRFFVGVARGLDGDAAAPRPTPSKAIDTRLSGPLARLVAPAIGKEQEGDPELGALARRNLLRVGGEVIERGGQAVLTPVPIVTGLEAAEALAARDPEVAPLTAAEVASLHLAADPAVQAAFGGALEPGDLPLWVYVLAEAELREGGQALGRLGARIIGETLVGLIRCDPDGVLSGGAPFEPTLVDPDSERAADGRYTMADLINYVQAPR